MKIIYYKDWSTLFFCQDKNASTTLVHYFRDKAETAPLVYWDESNTDPSDPELLNYLLRQPVRFQFTIVRNTWDRLSSLFHMLRQQMEITWPGKPKGHLHRWFSRFEPAILTHLGNNDDFASFVNYICSHNDQQVDSHWQPQHKNLPLGDSNFFVGRFEQFDKDVMFVLEKMGMEPGILPISNNQTSNFRSHYLQDYCERSRLVVAQRYAKEIELFGFRFGASINQDQETE